MVPGLDVTNSVVEEAHVWPMITHSSEVTF
jgi:hypothetical protein